jgi:hypothetical protein
MQIYVIISIYRPVSAQYTPFRQCFGQFKKWYLSEMKY